MKNDDMKYITTLKNGSHRISIRLGRGMDGKYLYDTKQLPKTIPINEVKKIRNKMLEDKDSKTNVDGSMRLELFAKKWLTEVVLDQSPNTYDSAYSKLKIHIIPALGHYKLKDINRDLVQEFVNYLTTKNSLNYKKEEKKLSPTTIKNITNILSGMLNYAVELHMIIDNPCHNLKMPKKEKYKKEVYNTTEIPILLEELSKVSAQNRALYVLFLTTGFRRGEIANLRWNSSIDFNKKIITVEKARYKTKIKGEVVTKPKSKYSERSVTLSDYALKCLIEYKEQQNYWKQVSGSLWKESSYIFTNEIGEPLSPNAISSRWRRFAKKLPLKYIRLHDLRATFATYLVYNDVPLADISKTMGHSRISTTVDLYVRNYENYYESSRNVINNIK